MTLILALSLSGPANAENSDFTIENGVLTEYNGPGGEVVIPDGVTSIGAGAFMRRKDVTSVTIPNSVTSIGQAAFWGCTGLTSIAIPNSVTEIGISLFSDCAGLISVSIPNSITAIDANMFKGCTGLTNVTIPNSITIIENGAFEGCTGLTSMFIPDSVTCVMAGAFSNCTGLTAIEVGENNQFYISVDGVLMNKEADTILAYPCGKQGAYTIPASVTNILPYTFSGCTGLTNIYVNPANRKYISVDGVLREKDSNIIVAYPSVEIKDGVYTVPEGISEIEYGMLNGNNNLICVVFPEGVEIIDISFCDCENLTSVIIPSTVRAIDPYAFSGCMKLRDVYFAGSKAEWEALGIERKLGDKSTELTNATIHFNSTGPTQPTQPTQPTTANAMPTNDALTSDGVLQTPTVYKIDGSNYFKIRDLAAILSGTEKQFSVGYDATLRSVTVITGQSYDKQSTDLAGAPASGNKTATISGNTIYIDGEKLDAQVYMIEGSNYFKLRDLGKALDFYVGWTKEHGVFIETDKPYQD